MTAVRQAKDATCGWPPGDIRQAVEDASDATDRAPDAATAAHVAENAGWYAEIEFADGIRLVVVGNDDHGVWAMFYGEVRFLAMLARDADGSWSAPDPLSCQPPAEPLSPLPEIVALDVSVGSLFAAGWAERRAVLFPSGDGSDVLLAQEGGGNGARAPSIDVMTTLVRGTPIPATVTARMAFTIDTVIGGH